MDASANRDRLSRTRPLIAIPARFSSSAAALRYEAEVAARKLIEAVYAAGGEPLAVHPSAPGGTVSDAEVARRLGFADGVLLPAGDGWFLAVQWHPEDTAAGDPAQQRLFGALVSAAARNRG